ncbi:diguanylate cyclase [bacterium]|nr:diguanylate cyclase [bacterium]
MINEQMKIIVVDDEPMITETLSMSLQEEDWQIFSANHGEEAIKLAKKISPDVAIIDLKLPDINGLEIARAIKNIDADVCVIIITGHAQMETAISALIEGAYDYITKPFDITHVKSVVQKGLQKRALALKNKELIEKLKREKRRIEAILEISKMFNVIFSLEDLVDFSVVKVSQMLEAQRGSLMLVDKDSKELFICGAYGLEEKIVKETRLKIGESIAGRVFETGEPLCVMDIENDLRLLRKNQSVYATKSFISIPIKQEKEIIGVFNFSNKEPFFTEEDVAFVSIVAHQTAIAIEKIRLYDKVTKLAVTDELTGLFNRRYFMKQLKEEIKRNQRYHHSLSLIMFDVDDFKKFNDNYSHLVGDAVLKKIAKILTENVRNVDVVSRYGGEEFIVILPETDIKEATRVAEKIRKSAEESLFGRKFLGRNQGGKKDIKKLTVSGGVATYQLREEIEMFIKRADDALYQAKKTGKNKIECAPVPVFHE